MRGDGPDGATRAPGEILDAAGVCALLGIGRSTLTRYVNGEGLPLSRRGLCARREPRTLRPMAGTPLHHRSAPRSVWNEPAGRSAVPGAR